MLDKISLMISNYSRVLYLQCHEIPTILSNINMCFDLICVFVGVMVSKIHSTVCVPNSFCIIASALSDTIFN